jgi:hypothetical protein
VDVEHTDIVKMFEEVNLFVERKRRKTTSKENSNCVLWINFLFFFYQRFFQKKECSIGRIFRRLGPFDY